MVTVAGCPGVSVPTSHTTASVQVPRSLATSIALKLGARVSVTSTAVAVEGPRLATSSVNVTSPRAGATATSAILAMVRSAGVAPPASVAELFESSMSPPPETVAVLIPSRAQGPRPSH